MNALTTGGHLLVSGPWEEVPPPVGAPGPLWIRRKAWSVRQGQIVTFDAARLPIKTLDAGPVVAFLGGLPIQLKEQPLAKAQAAIDKLLKAKGWDLA